ncbi:hypothetical protein KC19_VG080500 [Ceratodon purpureus]|uniref:Fungal lipase-type domain-containing protein n=1 Tax=Ceratodon purpureus TaxID=3225 RepID=A0A8T0HN75_CERPU|nr:hypothetical protein KC19_VG080500 [Ceratodon purpureus]
MEVLLVRAAVPFPCSRRRQKSGEASEPQKARAQSKFLKSTDGSTMASASNRMVDPQMVDPRTSPFSTLVPLSAFPLKFSWFQAANKEVGGDVSTTIASAACKDVTSLAPSDGTLPLNEEENRTVHEVLSTLSTTELSALEVASIEPMGSEGTVAEVVPGAMGSEELAKAEVDIAKSWLHNLMRIRSLWTVCQFNTNIKASRKQTPNSVQQSGAAVMEVEGIEKTEQGRNGSDSVVGGDVGEVMGCVCEECSVDTDDDNAAPVENERKEIAHIKIVHNRESFSKFLQSVPMAELKTVSHLSFLSNLAYVIPTIKPGDLLRHHGLRFITSSVHVKVREEKAAMENAAREKAVQDEAAAKGTARIKELEDALATSDVSSAKEVNAEKQIRRFPFMRKARTPVELAAYQSESLTSPVLPVDDVDGFCVECKSTLEAPHDAELSSTTPDTANVPPGNERLKQDAPVDVQPLHSCPCEWFICDDELSKIRNVSIQGSDSVASWQTNLLFEPTWFEHPKFGVMVHRGIYEAARALYGEVLPRVLEHVQKYGSEAKIRFTGHSLGGSLAILLSLMLRVRDTAPLSSLLPVYTFGSPFVLCGGDYLLQQLGFPQNHVQMVVMHRDIVPRSFTCTYPDHIAEVLKRVNGTFRDYSCLKKQSYLYAPMGVLRVIQPPPIQAPGHPYLPVGSGIYDILHPISAKLGTLAQSEHTIELRAAQRAFLNNPHPLDILRDRGSYGSRGGISRDHDPRSYSKAVNYVLKQELKKVLRSHKTEKRVQLVWPSLATDCGAEFIKVVVLKGPANSVNSVNSGESGSLGAASSGMGATHQVFRRAARLVDDGRSMSSTRDTITSGSTMDRLSRYSRLIASKHVHIGMLLIISVRVLLMQALATFIA